MDVRDVLAGVGAAAEDERKRKALPQGPSRQPKSARSEADAPRSRGSRSAVSELLEQGAGVQELDKEFTSAISESAQSAQAQLRLWAELPVARWERRSFVPEGRTDGFVIRRWTLAGRDTVARADSAQVR
eukprot:gnl/TRDRNA2_/TRDRNA2_35489_c0_seq1.p1 gnl/TRDRNA2_/TRDRNA2_35489_c0~~gnl/TRDRNA2_/TRDRNA2_35489_c0_seq1.p1  ORF type:complete len:130 (+),score=18.46 gnl/TRDRNA2_/TRDRNA2_35489_c0_seq1:59-448(+)